MTKSNKSGAAQDWRKELSQLLDKHDGMASLSGKIVNHKTRKARAGAYRRMFTLLRQAGFKIGPLSLGGKHVEFLMQYWTADPRALEGLRTRNSKLEMLEAPYSPSYILQQTSFLRTICEWTGKLGLVMPARRYVSDPALVSCTAPNLLSLADPSRYLDRIVVLRSVTRADPLVGLQLELLLAFGLKRREAVAFCPTLAEVPPHALPAGAKPGDYIAIVRVIRGTPSGHVRLIPLRNAQQRELFDRAKAAAAEVGALVSDSDRSVKQATTRFTNVLRRNGVTLRRLGVTPHWAKHEFAADIYLNLRVLPRSGQMVPLGSDKEMMDAVYDEVARRLERQRTRALHKSKPINNFFAKA